jgi:hypothetical protein
MKDAHKPRKDDHVVEPLYGALREEGGALREEGGAVRENGDAAGKEGEPRAADWRWKIVWVIVGALAIGYVVWRQAF